MVTLAVQENNVRNIKQDNKNTKRKKKSGNHRGEERVVKKIKMSVVS